MHGRWLIFFTGLGGLPPARLRHIGLHHSLRLPSTPALMLCLCQQGPARATLIDFPLAQPRGHVICANPGHHVGGAVLTACLAGPLISTSCAVLCCADQGLCRTGAEQQAGPDPQQHCQHAAGPHGRAGLTRKRCCDRSEASHLQLCKRANSFIQKLRRMHLRSGRALW